MNIASPLADVAAGLGLSVRHLPARVLRNISGTFDLVEIDLDDGPDEVAIDPVCRMRLDPAEAVAWLREGDQVRWFCSRTVPAAA